MSKFHDHASQPASEPIAPFGGQAADAYHDMVLVAGRLFARGAMRFLEAMKTSRKKRAEQLIGKYRRE